MKTRPAPNVIYYGTTLDRHLTFIPRITNHIGYSLTAHLATSTHVCAAWSRGIFSKREVIASIARHFPNLLVVEVDPPESILEFMSRKPMNIRITIRRKERVLK